MTAREFIAKWQASTLKERSASQSHFNDLCALIGQLSPVAADPIGEHFTFERGAAKTGGGEGWADVWKKGCFAWEYKGKHKDLTAAFSQLQRYAIALENPPLLVVSDMETIIIHTNFTNTVQEIHTLALDELELPEARQKLLWLFTEPERFRPGVTRRMVTEQAAQTFAGVAQTLRNAGHDSHSVAHFVNKLIFCMFAEDSGLLPGQLFTRMVESVQARPEKFAERARLLFAAMRDGGEIGFGDVVPWFNGGLFADAEALPLDAGSLAQLLAGAKLDWSEIEPAIFGTLFERGLDPAKRSQLGAHYTDRDSILRIVGPVVVEPLEREWRQIKTEIGIALDKKSAPARKKGEEVYRAFLAKLRALRVLDPACGSGNFLYLALVELKNLEHRVMLEGELFGFQRDFPQIGPHNVLGIEINDYAAELARVTVWIGDIQWSLKNGLGYSTNPILKTLDTITCRDALLNPDGTEATWPAADCIVGNPPFLGDKKMLAELGEEYVTRLRARFKGRVPGGADLVTYWFEKARGEIAAGRVQRAGLVATNSVRGGANRKVLERICASGRIFNAWSDEPWINDGAAVRVSLVCFAGNNLQQPVIKGAFILNGSIVDAIYPDLTGPTDGAAGLNLSEAKALIENAGTAFNGIQKTGAFEVPGEIARKWLQLPMNPNGRPNSDVLFPYWNGIDLTRRSRDSWIVDFGWTMTETESAEYEAPFEYLLKEVKPVRLANNLEALRRIWWRHWRPRPVMRMKINALTRYIVTPEVSKHRIFVFQSLPTLPDKNLVVIARDDDTTFGILHSRFHELWALRMCTFLGVGNDPRYTPTTCFETFPFPTGLEPVHTRTAATLVPGERGSEANPAIATTARRLVELRDNWLNPPDATAEELKKRTLTNLYNQRPQWLDNAHAALDAAVAAAYGWPVDLADDEVLGRLLALNRERSGRN